MTVASSLEALFARLQFIAFTQALSEPDPSVYEQELTQSISQEQDPELRAFLLRNKQQLSLGGPETFLSLLLAHPQLHRLAPPLCEQWGKPLLQPSPRDHTHRHQERVGCILPISDGSWLSAGWDASLKHWSSMQCLQTWSGYIEITSMTAHPAKPLLYFTASDAAVWSWSLESRRPSRFVYHQRRPLCVTFLSQPEMIISSGDDRIIQCWSTKGRLLQSLEGHKSSVASLAVLPNQRALLSASFDCTLKLWEISSGQCIDTFSGDKDQLTQLQLHPDGTKAFLGTQEKSIRLVDLKTGQELYKLPGTGSAVSSMSLSFDGRWLAVAFYDGSLRLFDINAAEYVARFVSQHPICACRFLTNHQLATGDTEGNLQLFTIRPTD
jgi:WD40 repeat protein